MDHTAPQDVISYVTSVQERFEKLRSLARQTESGNKDDCKQQFYKKTKKRKFGVGDFVLLRAPPIGHKLWNEWEGPYYITKVISDTTYELAMPNIPGGK